MQSKSARLLCCNALNVNAHIDTESKWLLKNNNDVIFLTENSLV
ncbi:hypothetical protein SALWKB12_1352 [Snodgrassella communis]|uniref:Uncharacterized protein n=1 Tax=Snodgrassella communis TaxID=2946699 RepID=A0A837AGH0_9NEIS|nr:hypothetical protein SALWKB12_1352 [Snodgrassella communis]KDN14996.1 hypothetical protein SALWKB29_1068 [Snodgrassella communis]